MESDKPEGPEKIRLFLNEDTDPAIPVNIDEARQAYKLLMERPPTTFGIESVLTRHIKRLVIVTLRKLLHPPYSSHLPGASSSTSSSSNVAAEPYIAQMEVLNPPPGKESDKVQQRMVNLFATLYACPLITDPLHFEVRVCSFSLHLRYLLRILEINYVNDVVTVIGTIQ